MDCVLSDIKNANLGTGRSSQGIEDKEEVHYGGEGPHWAVVPSQGRRRRNSE